jgi:hypothetical protein
MSRAAETVPLAHALPCSLLGDDSLGFSASPDVLPLVEPWLPLGVRRGTSGRAAAVIHVQSGAPGIPLPAGKPAMEMCGVHGWVFRAEEEAVLCDLDGRIGARVDLAARRAFVWLRAGAGDAPPVVQVVATLTMAAALLLTRLQRALVHAAGVVAPGGGAWLLVGGSFSGKTTTCVNLIRGGWDWLSDDHVVLGSGAGGGVGAEGWPRRFNLDHGYAAGASRGLRSRVDPGGFGPGRRTNGAGVAGLLFPRVDAALPTGLSPLHPAEALALLLRNTPWLLADAGGAGPVLGLLERAARLPACELRLGQDSYCNPGALQTALAPALEDSFPGLAGTAT